MKKYTSREEAMAAGWTGDNWLWCGACDGPVLQVPHQIYGRGTCSVITCTGHLDAGKKPDHVPITNERLAELAAAGERCVAGGVDAMLDGVSSRGLGEMAAEILKYRLTKLTEVIDEVGGKRDRLIGIRDRFRCGDPHGVVALDDLEFLLELAMDNYDGYVESMSGSDVAAGVRSLLESDTMVDE